MKNISLKTLSITVVVASLASNFVFASDDMSKASLKVEQPVSSFSQLISDYDTDKNNTLSIKLLATADRTKSTFFSIYPDSI